MISILISNFIILLILFFLCNKLLKLRDKPSVYFILIFIFTFIMMTLVNFQGVTNLSGIIIFLLFLLFIHLCSNDTIIKKMLVIIPFFAIISASEVIAITLLRTFLSINDFSNINSFYNLIALIITNIINIIFAIFYVKIRSIFNISTFPKYSFLIFILPFVTIFLIFNIKNYNSLLKSDITFFLSIFGLFLANIISIYIFFTAIESINIKNNLEMIKQSEKEAIAKFELIKQINSNTYDYFHSLLNKCDSMNKLLNAKDYDSLQVQLTELTENTYNSFNSLFSNSQTLNSLIQYNEKIIKDNNISIKTTIEFDNIYLMDQYDVNELFSEMLNISINSCIECDVKNNKNIIIKTKKIDNCILIQFIFSSLPSFTFKPTLSLSRIFEKYNITFIPTFQNSNNTTNILIIIDK